MNPVRTMKGLLAALVVLAFVSQLNASTAPKTDHDMFMVTGYDFQNTNVKKVCMLAKIQATIHLSKTSGTGSPTTHSTAIPGNASTSGSYCNRNFLSLLQLNFNNHTVILKFKRTFDNTTELNKVASYCRDCNYGVFSLLEISITMHHEGKELHGMTTSKYIQDHAPPDLNAGIGIRRSFKCNKTDTIVVIPIRVTKVLNATNRHVISDGNWNANISFDFMQFQPFLVAKSTKHGYTFADPYLCRDVTAAHVTIILLPLVYFAIFIAFHRIKATYGCPPKRQVKSNTKYTSHDNVVMEEGRMIGGAEFQQMHSCARAKKINEA